MSKSMESRYLASMLLSGTGDALGYKNGDFEFNKSGPDIHREVKKLGGVAKIKVELPGWRVSDDTVMHLATAEALISHGPDEPNNNLYSLLAQKYIDCVHDMSGRAPGNTCLFAASELDSTKELGFRRPYNPWGAGCGAAMRAMCIGLRYPRSEDIDHLVAVATESGRMTHNQPMGFLGSVATALFTSYAVQGIPIIEWGCRLLKVLPKSLDYIQSTDHCYEKSKNDWSKFTGPWEQYLQARCISDGQSQPKFPEKFGIEERDEFYTSVAVNPSKWPGACGVDSAIIAYDALLGAGDSWEELCSRSMFHCGDSDSTGVIAAAWFGAIYGLSGVPECNYAKLEYRDRLEDCAVKLYKLSQSSV